ncbi:MAG: VWA domain-containing protein, partial [Verrucomicrobiales bacterium]|nr:VWA domain-containing protein [Verrucomicrobiales bacterium]
MMDVALLLLVIMGLAWGLDRYGHWLERRKLAAKKNWLILLRDAAAIWWHGLGRRGLNHPLFKNVRRVYVFAVAMHLALLLTLGLLSRSAPVEKRGQFAAHHVTSAPEFVEPDLAPRDFDPPATSGGDADGGNDIQLPPNYLTGVTLIPDNLIGAQMFTPNPAPPSNSSGNIFRIGATGFGGGKGGGYGKGGGRGFADGKLGGMNVPFDVAVVLDISGSMDPYLKVLREQIRLHFSRAPVINSDDSLGTVTPTVSGKKRAVKSSARWVHLYDAVYKAMKSRVGLDAVYVLSDFQDGEYPEHTAALVEELRRRGIRLYLCYTRPDSKPWAALMRY